jgi:molybdopterin molybdotransferase
MTEFFNVQPVRAALDILFTHWIPQAHTEIIDSRHALGRVLAVAPLSPMDLPMFTRSTMDGYAVRAADTFGTSSSLPSYLTLIGQVMMGAEPTIEVRAGQAAEIHTGAMLPPGADAVVMVERTQVLNGHEIEVLSPVAPGENLVQIGEDVGQGQAILPKGHRLRPQDIGGLLSVGVTSVEVVVPPRVGILSSGDELVTPDDMPAPGQIRDINAHVLSALVQQAGGESSLVGIVRDNLEDFLPRAQTAYSNVDILVMTAGSSVSARDLTAEIINRLGNPGVLQHGLAVKPGKPTILGVCDGKPVIGLPGNPVSALLVARQIIVPILKRALGETPRPSAMLYATLIGNIASTTGREDSVPVRLSKRDGAWYAEPVFGKSNLIFTLVNADGVAHIPLNSNGFRAGSTVEVSLFD